MGRKDQDKPKAEPESPSEKDVVESEAVVIATPDGEEEDVESQEHSIGSDTPDDASDDTDAVPPGADAPDLAAAAHEDEVVLEAEHHDELDEHGSFPTWMKVALILIFGAVLALWGGPRLAPHLPSGLEPVARFLAPGAVRQAQEINDRLAALERREPPGLPQDAVDAAVAAALADYDATVSDRLQEMGDTVSAVGSGEIKTRLAQLETTVEGLEVQMASLREQVAAAIAESIDRQTAMSAEQAAAYQAMIDRLNAELDQLAARQGGLQQAIDEVSATNTRIREEAQTIVSATQAEKALTDISAALDTGAPYRSALDTLTGAVDADLPALNSLADSGAPSLATLQADFVPLAYEALRAAMQAEAQGYSGKALAFFKSQVVTRSLTPQAGDSTDAILSRMDAALSAGNLSSCLTEADALPEAAREPLADWLSSVATLSAAMAELDTAKAQVARQKS